MDLSTFINAGLIGGWVRSVVGALLAVAIARYSWLGDYLTPDMQAAVGVFVSGFVVGVWSHVAKMLQQDKK